MSALVIYPKYKHADEVNEVGSLAAPAGFGCVGRCFGHSAANRDSPEPQKWYSPVPHQARQATAAGQDHHADPLNVGTRSSGERIIERPPL